PFAYENFYDFTPVNELESSGLSMQIDYDFEQFSLTSITAYRTFDRFEDADVDFTSARLVSTNNSDTSIDTFTQEFRLTSTGDGSVNWLLGAFFFDEEVRIDDDIRYDDQFRVYGDFLATIAAGGTPGVTPSPLGGLETALNIPAGTFLGVGQGIGGQSGQDDTTFNLFAQFDFDIGDRATLTLGANYAEVEKDAFANLVSNDVFAAVDLVQVGFAQAFQATTMLDPTPANIAAFAQANPAGFAALQAAAADPAQNPLLGLQALQFLPPFVTFPNTVENGQSVDDAVTWTARFTYDMTDDINVYVSAGTGFKATSWNLSRDSRPFAVDIPALVNAGLGVNNLSTTGTRFARPEDSTVYEIGLKGQFDNFAINVAIFDQEIEDFQENLFIGTGFSLQNAGKQSTTGIEIDMTWYPIDDLQLTFASTFLDPEYDSFPEGNDVNGPADLSGTQPPGIHEVSLSTSGTYTFDIGNAEAFIRAEYVYDDEQPIVANVPASIASREVSVINASFGLAWDNGFEAFIWGRNITDDEYLLSAFPSVAQAGSFSGYPVQPATYGVTATMHFD
ncbi:MAG: TonB-dependent receptor, partial [Pseudomonadota bacterium]